MTKSSAIDSVAATPARGRRAAAPAPTARGRRNGSEGELVTGTVAASPVAGAQELAGASEATEASQRAAVGRGRPQGAVDKAPRKPRATREPKAETANAGGGFDTRDIVRSINAKVSEAKKAKRTTEAEFKTNMRVITSHANAALKAQSDAQTAHDKAIASHDKVIADGEALLAKLQA
jgi:hypothetical protein